MSEEQQYRGDRWTQQTKSILSSLSWIQKGDSNFDIPCYNRPSHKTGKEDRKNPHGIDLLFSYFDPYKKYENTVLVESKERKWNGISTATLQSFVTQLHNSIECARMNENLESLGCLNLNDGLLVIWCNERDQFDQKKFKEYVNGLKISRRKNPINIYIASNKEILQWCSLIQKIDQLKTEYNEFNFFFPSDYFSSGLTTAIRQEQLNLTHMFSDYIFAKGEKTVEHYGGSYIERVNHVFFFAEPSLEELKFMDNCIQHYQFGDAHRLVIHFYGQQVKSRTNYEQYFRDKQTSLKKDGSNLKIEYDYMIKLEEVPENFTFKG
ncbi:hypothetical protein P4284_02315 [Bacillus swezeyi]|uniref:hypothetical protein n=1 Tax=Bacillus swezeyi TaxID=1925020 RepID=UPI002E1E447C|nr:hypothetical protein [Bacillus swezeyi]